MFHQSFSLISQIGPYLFLGSADAAESRVILEKYGISVVVSILSEEEFQTLKVPSDYYLDHYRLVASDAEGNIIPVAEAAYPIIEQAIARKENILVHCAFGISRSVSVVLFYLMKNHGWSWKRAWKFVKGLRKCASPASLFRRQLQDYF